MEETYVKPQVFVIERKLDVDYLPRVAISFVRVDGVTPACIELPEHRWEAIKKIRSALRAEPTDVASIKLLRSLSDLGLWECKQLWTCLKCIP